MSLAILIQNPTLESFASTASTTNTSGSNLTSDSNTIGGEGMGTGGPEVIASLLSQEETNNNTATSSNSTETDAVFHTQELAVTKHNLRQGETSDAITGTIVNNSPLEVNYIDINAALFNVNNNLIGTVSGSIDFPTLQPGEDTTFKIDINKETGEMLDHYMLFVLGTPKTD